MNKHENCIEMYGTCSMQHVPWNKLFPLPKCKASPECISAAGSGLTGEHPRAEQSSVWASAWKRREDTHGESCWTCEHCTVLHKQVKRMMPMPLKATLKPTKYQTTWLFVTIWHLDCLLLQQCLNGKWKEYFILNSLSFFENPIVPYNGQTSPNAETGYMTVAILQWKHSKTALRLSLTGLLLVFAGKWSCIND